jgi:trehalose utilization protein
VYPDGIHAVLAHAIRERGHDVRTATLDEPEHGLDEATLADTDVLVWWGHRAHDEVRDEVPTASSTPSATGPGSSRSTPRTTRSRSGG